MSSSTSTTPLPSSTSTPPTTTSSSTPTPTSTSSTTPTDTTTTTSSSSTTSASTTSNETSSSSSSISSSSSTPSSSTLTASSTVAVPTTLVSTSADGQTFTIVSTATTVLSPGATVSVSSSNDSVSSTSHTGAIVGGAVGGGAALILVFILIFVICRRHRRRQRSLDAFDGNFDPDRVVTTQRTPRGEPKGLSRQGPTLPNIAAGDEDDGMGGRLAGSAIGGGVVAPYPLYHPTTSAPTSTSRPAMSAQHTGVSTSQGHGSVPASAYAAAYGAAATPSVTGSGSSTPYGFASSDRLPNPYSAGPQSTSSGGGSAAHGNRFNVANPDADTGHFVGGFVPGRFGGAEKSAAGLASSKESRDVLVHQDGGRVDPQSGGDSEGPDEIPPTYDSLVPEASGSALPREKR